MDVLDLTPLIPRAMRSASLVMVPRAEADPQPPEAVFDRVCVSQRTFIEVTESSPTFEPRKASMLELTSVYAPW